MPQLYKNYRMKSNGAEALSLSFLVIWLIGDLLYITGSSIKIFITKEMPAIFLLISAFYTISDLGLIIQTIF